MLNLVKKIPEKLNSGRNFKKFRFWSKFLEISILVDVLKKILILAKFSKMLFLSAFSEIISILVKSFKNLDFGQNFR